MNHDLADDPVFEDALRSALRADASRAPLPQPSWEESSYLSRRSPPRPSTGRARRRLAVLVAAAVVVAGVAAGVEQGRTLARRGDRTDRTGTVPPVLPRGDEYPVTEVAGVTATPSGVVKPGSWRAFTGPWRRHPPHHLCHREHRSPRSGAALHRARQPQLLAR